MGETLAALRNVMGDSGNQPARHAGSFLQEDKGNAALQRVMPLPDADQAVSSEGGAFAEPGAVVWVRFFILTVPSKGYEYSN
jgi:hypothetical protein